MPNTLLLTAAFAATATLASAGQVSAQAVPNRAAVIEVRKQFLADLDTLNRKFIALANVFPADKYAWRPGPGVRSVGEVFMHVASEFYGYAPAAYGAPPSSLVPTEESEKTLEQKSTKTDVLAQLPASLAYARKTIDGLDPSALVGTKKLLGGDATIVSTSLAVVDDMHEHMGQLIAYARMNGITPPWSKP